MFQTLILPAFGALLLVGGVLSGAWAVRPRQDFAPVLGALTAETETSGSGIGTGTGTATGSGTLAPNQSAARARAARGRTRNGLLGALLVVAEAFLAVRLLFVLPGWFQLAWAVAVLAAAFVVWRVVVLWPAADDQRRLDDLLRAHGLRPVRLPWGLLVVVVLLLALWAVPPLLLF